jgi:hypothetical protein
MQQITVFTCNVLYCWYTSYTSALSSAIDGDLDKIFCTGTHSKSVSLKPNAVNGTEISFPVNKTFRISKIDTTINACVNEKKELFSYECRTVGGFS